MKSRRPEKILGYFVSSLLILGTYNRHPILLIILLNYFILTYMSKIRYNHVTLAKDPQDEGFVTQTRPRFPGRIVARLLF